MISYKPNLYANFNFKNSKPQTGLLHRSKWFIHGPKRRKNNQLQSLKHSY